MKITILNGNPDHPNAPFEEYLRRLKATLEAHQHQVTLLPLREMEIRYCIGCFGCWVKTPGECFAQDLSSQVVERRSPLRLYRLGFPAGDGLSQRSPETDHGQVDPADPSLFRRSIITRPTTAPATSTTLAWVCYWQKKPIPTTKISASSPTCSAAQP